jgi:peptide/nickel transport system permease protein
MKIDPRLKRAKLLWSGGLIIVFMILIAVFAGILATHDPGEIALAKRFLPPSFDAFFGTDHNGADIFSRTLFGARISLLVALSVVLISSVIGIIVGSIAGYAGGTVDLVIMRFLDMLYAFPGFLLALSMVAVLGPSLFNLILAMAVTGWAGYARLIRGEVLHLKERDHVQAAVALGAGHIRIVAVHILPNLMGPLIVQATFGMAGTIIAESSLSFLGLGAPPEVPTWGAMLNSGRQYLLEAPHLSLYPGLCIVILVLGFNLFGDGLRDYLDPKQTIG